MSDDTAAAAPQGATMGEQRWIAVYDGHWWLIEHEGGGIVAEGIQKEDAERIVSDHNELQEARAALAAMTQERDDFESRWRAKLAHWKQAENERDDAVSREMASRSALAAMTALAESLATERTRLRTAMEAIMVRGVEMSVVSHAHEEAWGCRYCWKRGISPQIEHVAGCPLIPIRAALSEPPAGEAQGDG